MPETPRMGFPYPNKDETDWYDAMQSFFAAVDASCYAHREDRNLIMYSTAQWTWDAVTGGLSWDADVYFTGAQTGGRWRVLASSLTIPDGYMMVVNLVRYPQTTVTVNVVEARSACEHTDEGVVVCVRVGSTLYYRTGISQATGTTINIFAASGGSGGGDVEEHQRDMHSNGIVRSATSSTAMELSVTDNGGLADDDLNVAAVPATDRYYVNGEQRTEPSAPYTYANPALVADDVKLYRAYVQASGDPQLLERASFNVAGLGYDPFRIVNCSEGLTGAKNLTFDVVIGGAIYSVRFDGGPFLLGSAGIDGVLRLWSQDGVNWVDVWFDAAWDWTNVAGLTNVPITFALTDIDPDTDLLLGSPVAWHSGGFVQWGYGASKDVVDQRLFGNLGAGEVRDDLLQLISERALTTGISGVIFDRKEGWTGRQWGGVQPRFEFPQYNFSLEYSSPNLTIHGGKLLLDGIVVDVPTTVLALNLTLLAEDYYIWYDRSDGTVKATAESSFPTAPSGSPNPISWILGGSVSAPDYLSTVFEKPARGVPLYVVQRGAADNQIDEATLCDLRRNVTKPALKAHPTVCFRPDWQTASFPAFGNIPDLTQTESEFGCLDAAFRYIQAVPDEVGDFSDYTGAGAPNSTQHTARLVEVVGYTEERRGLVTPEGTMVQGRGRAIVVFPAGSQYPISFDDGFPGGPIDVMLQVATSSALKDVIVFLADRGSMTAAVGLGSGVGPGSLTNAAPVVLENCQVVSDSQIAVAGQIYSGGFSPSVVISQCLLWASDFTMAGGKTGYGLFFGDDAENVHIIDSTVMGDDHGIYVTTEADTCFIDRSFIIAGSLMGGGGTAWPNGYGIYSSEVQGFIVHTSMIHSEHVHAVSMGGGSKSDASAVLDGVIITGGDMSGQAINKEEFVHLEATPQIMQDCYISTFDTDDVPTQLTAVHLTQTSTTLIRNNILSVNGDQRAWDFGLLSDGGEAEIIGNLITASSLPIAGGVTIGVSTSTGCKIIGNVVKSFGGFQIEAAATSSDLLVSGNTAAGGNYGNGIWCDHAGAVIEGNEVNGCKSFGIHIQQYARVYGNRIWNVYHDVERPEGVALFEEYGAWGIRYGYYDGFSGELLDILIHDNDIVNIASDVETPPNGNLWLCCGIGPTWETDVQQHLRQVQIKDNRINNVLPGGMAPMLNTLFAGIVVKHPSSQVAVDGNQIETVGGGSDAWQAFGIASWIGGNVLLPSTLSQVSISGNHIKDVVGNVSAFGIFAGIASQMVVDGNHILDCEATGGTTELITLTNPGGLTIDMQQIRVSKNALDFLGLHTGTASVGIRIDNDSIDDILVTENQIGEAALTAGGAGIVVEGDGLNVTVKMNQLRWSDAEPWDYGILVVSDNPLGLSNVNVDQNEIYGEVDETGGGSVIHIESVESVAVAVNKLLGYGGSTQYGNGIHLLLCNHIEVGGNIVREHLPAATFGLLHLMDCLDGIVHDNLLEGTTGSAAPLSSLLCVGTSQGTMARMHIHDNKITPHGDGVGFFDMDFPSAAINYLDLSIWANVFGSSTAVGTQNFTLLLAFPAGPYIMAPAADNWTGAAFV